MATMIQRVRDCQQKNSGCRRLTGEPSLPDVVIVKIARDVLLAVPEARRGWRAKKVLAGELQIGDRWLAGVRRAVYL